MGSRIYLLARSIVAVLAVTMLTGCTSANRAPEGPGHIVEIRNLAFHPARLNLRPGDTVTFINRDFVPHTATALDNDAVTAQRQWSTEELSQHARETLTFTREMAGTYYCRYHPGMTALLISTDG